MDRADLAVEQWAPQAARFTLPMALFGRLNEAAERVMREHMNPLFARAGLQAGNSTFWRPCAARARPIRFRPPSSMKPR